MSYLTIKSSTVDAFIVYYYSYLYYYYYYYYYYHCFRDVFSLDLRNNFITALTEFTLRDLSNLRYLFLSNNRIYTIDKRTFRSLPSLLYLVLKGNPLQEVTRFYFYAPSSLSYVDLSECSLSQLPSGLPLSIRYLQMRRNNLTSLTSGAFKECPDVNIVVLDENRIESVDGDAVSGLRRLQQVNIELTMVFIPFYAMCV